MNPSAEVQKNSTSMLTSTLISIWKSFVSLSMKFIHLIIFILKYSSLGVHFILEYIFIKVLLKWIIIAGMLLNKLFIIIKEALIKSYHNSKAYKNKMLKLELERNALLSSMDKTKTGKRSGAELTYRYKVKDQNGKIKVGYMSALSKLDVMSYLLNEGFIVYKIDTSKFIQFVHGRSSFVGVKLKTKDLIFWLTQLSTYIKSGIPLADSVKILSKQLGKKGSEKKLFESLIYELTMGNSFSEAMKKQKGVFPPLLINMLKAAEATGELEETLDEMVNYYTEMDKTKKAMISAMTYPAIISLFAGGVIVFIVLYIIPKFTAIYDQIGAKVTGITVYVIMVSDFLQANIAKLVLGLVLAVILFIFSYKKIKSFRAMIQTILMKTPVVSKVVIYNELTIFTKTFASLLRNNVFITDSMDILSQITNNEIYRKIMYKTISNIAKGEKISESFKDHWAIPEVAYYMIVTGESTGELPAMMEKVSVFYQQEHRNIIGTLKSFIEPVMIVGLAISVGTIIISVIIPMFSLYGEIGV